MNEIKRKIIERSFISGICNLIRWYQKCISPLLGPRCRFYPSCSTYALLAIEQSGLIKGCYWSALRIGKCHPFHPGGVDFPPKV